MHEGHRKRMMERIKASEDGFQDHELLEVLLYNAIPRKNTNEIAHALLQTFGSLNGVLQASFERLCCVDGVGESTAAYLRCVGVTLSRCSIAKREEFPQITNFSDIQTFIRSRFQENDREKIELYGVDSKGVITFVKTMSSNHTDKVQISPEEIGTVLTVTRPHSVIVAHNHIDGTCSPSVADHLFTKQVQMICSLYGIELYDHVIISEGKTYSYFLTGELNEIKNRYNLKNMFGEAEK